MNAARRRQGTGTLFSHAVALTGMSLAETAAFLGISEGTARAYSLGTRDAPAKTLDRLADLWMRMSLRGEPGDLPAPVAERRQAVLDLRSRAWRPKAALTKSDLKGEGDIKTAMAWARHLAAGKAKAAKPAEPEEQDEDEDDE